MATHLHIDPFSGIAGDMFLGALLHLGLDAEALKDRLGRLPVAGQFELRIEPTVRRGITATALKVKELSHDHDHHHHDDHGHDHSHHHNDGHHHHHHHHVGFREITAMIPSLGLTERGQQRAEAVVRVLGEAEAKVHGIALEKVHFHEVGAVDSIVDMLGSVVGLELLDIETVSCGVLPISRGMVRCDHGLMPVPAPATAELLTGLPTQGVDRVGELVTPTGAALVRALTDRFGPPPAMTIEGVGYGAGDRDDPEVPNVLRLMLGETSPKTQPVLTPEPAGVGA
ncbi:MAG: LarC family nickel insertion protein [Planctomycetota bacterium]